MSRRLIPFACFFLAFIYALPATAWAVSYPVIDSGQTGCYDAERPIACPGKDQAFFGQDAQYQGAQPNYRDNGDGTVSDLNTGLVWVKARGEKVTWEQAMARAGACRVGGYSDWRVPSIKELYSLINFNGGQGQTEETSRPYLDTRFFEFRYGDQAAGDRLIDCQDWSSTQYLGLTMDGAPTVFGVNFADGRIKGYPRITRRDGRPKTLYVRYVRGNPAYGKNSFTDNGDGTVTDAATGLVWQKADSGRGMDWKAALAYAEGLTLAGHDDWRLPNAKELQSIVNYSRVPAIDPVFAMSDPKAYYWTSTTHLDGGRADAAVYLAFGPAMGYMEIPPGSGGKRLLDVHGAGAQRSDPKSGDPARYPKGRGPQGDDIRIDNLARCVRGGQTTLAASTDAPEASALVAPAAAGAPAGVRPGRPGSPGGAGMDLGQAPGGTPGGRLGPPDAAYAACRDKDEGETCAFTAPHGRVTGWCGLRPEGFVCLPHGGPGDPGGPDGRRPAGS